MGLLRLLVFFPSINFNLTAAEVFPWATLYGAMRLRSISVWLGILLITMGVSALWTIATHGGPLLAETLRSMAAYANPIIAFLAIIHCSDNELVRLERAARWVLGGLVVVGLLQVAGLAVALEPLLQNLIKRASGETLGAGRGVTLLSSEPSRAAVDFLFVYLVIRASMSARPTTRAIVDLLVACFLIFALRSVVGLGYLGVFAFYYYPVATILVGLLAVSAAGYFADIRIFALIIELAKSEELRDAILYVFNQSGFRIISVISAYSYALVHPFGGGLGAWEMSSLAAFSQLGMDASEISWFQTHAEGQFVSLRPTAYAANIALDLGLVGLLLFAVWILKFFSLSHIFNRYVGAATILWLIFVWGMGAAGNPVPWVCLAILYRRYVQRQNNRSEELVEIKSEGRAT